MYQLVLSIDSEGMVNLLGYLPKRLNRAKYNEDELKIKIKKASTLDTMQKMLSRLSIQCFHKCVPKPEDSLDSRQRLCISMCMDRYMDSYTLVARAFGNRLQAELKESLAQQQAQGQS
ncbi:mitochondrial import inner membrane translocase subunit Tim13 isoform X2 [Drosophila mojavensis]|uniref:mitochondrial import inner membrane translocase subunit Tim13 isoform X2 n=1 Tax=Drosophila mojavensis TaxID=7230 RepID=UPI001CD12AE7|nr:mitochondrial import inner membrane translocase subunit Tim13 isoform X2 [Drosophila mojavensis]